MCIRPVTGPSERNEEKASQRFYRLRRIIVTAICPTLLCVLAAAQESTKADVDWPIYNGSYAADRFSPLSQITPANVQSLVQVGRYQLPETTSFQAGPLVIDDTMFVTTATSTYALDARTGTMRWVQKYAPKSMGLNTPVRGAAYDQGRLYRGTPDARVLALDAKSGGVIWDVSAGSPEKGEYFDIRADHMAGPTVHRHFWKRCRCNRKNDGAGYKGRKAPMEL